MTTTTHQNLIGQRINYTGDMANAPRSGMITDITEDRWGTHAVILWDEDESTGWDDSGEAVSMYAPCTRIGIHQIDSANSPGSRFILA